MLLRLDKQHKVFERVTHEHGTFYRAASIVFREMRRFVVPFGFALKKNLLPQFRYRKNG